MLGDNIIADLKATYRKLVLETDNRLVMETDVLGGRLASIELRRQVLDDIEKEVNGELEKLQKRNSELSKILGCPRHNLNK